MPDRTRHRVARRYLESASKTAVIAHVDCDGHRWGWFVNGVQRLHVVPFDPEYVGSARIWLEDGCGNRSFIVDQSPRDRQLDVDDLRASASKSRDAIESAWLRSPAPSVAGSSTILKR